MQHTRHLVQFVFLLFLLLGLSGCSQVEYFETATFQRNCCGNCIELPSYNAIGLPQTIRVCNIPVGTVLADLPVRPAGNWARGDKIREIKFPVLRGRDRWVEEK